MLLSVNLITVLFFFFNDTATTEIYTLSLHDALPIFRNPTRRGRLGIERAPRGSDSGRSEEHTSELQSHNELVCRLLLEKKKQPHAGPQQPDGSYSDSKPQGSSPAT